MRPRRLRTPLLVTVSAVLLAIGAGAGATTNPALAPPIGPFSTGCARVPASGTLAPGASASISPKYSNLWTWTAGSAGQQFQWTITNTTPLATGQTSSSGSRSVPAANHGFTIRNLGVVGQWWTVCWYD